MFKPRPWRKTGKIIICLICNKPFYNRQSENRKYCSSKCYWEDLKGRPCPTKGIKRPQFSGKNHPRFKENKKDSSGYVIILMPSHPFAMRKCYMFEHRLVVEKIIGRYLLPEEIVHHEGKKDDNRPKMLIAFKHKSFHNSHHAGKIVDDCNIVFDGRKLAH